MYRGQGYRGNYRGGRGGSQDQPQFHQPGWGQDVVPNQYRANYDAGMYQGPQERGRGAPRRGRRPPVGGSKPKSDAPKTEEPPQAGKYLSKKSSPESNDPLYKEAFVPESGTDLHPIPGLCTFIPSSIGFIELVDQVYTALCSKDANYGRRIPESVFTYYCAVGLWARLLCVHQMNGFQTTPAEREFVSQVKELNPTYPNIITLYINGFGNFEDLAGVKFDMKLFDRLPPTTHTGVPGWWGRVNVDTHLDYENFLCPAVAALRVIKDLDFLGGVDPAWNLPDDIQPAPVELRLPGHPTENLLGWKPAVALRQEAVQFINACGIRGGRNADFHSSNDTVAFNVALMTSVMEYTERTVLMALTSISFVNQGSLAQDPWVQPAEGERYMPGTGRIQRRERLVQYSSEKINNKVSNAGSVFMLRYKRRTETIEEIENEEAVPVRRHIIDGILRQEIQHRDGEPPVRLVAYNNWCCYAWGDYDHVPIGWVENANDYWDTIIDPKNYVSFGTSLFDQRSRVKVTLRAFEKATA